MVIFRLDGGDLQNGLVSIINRLPAERFRYSVICIDRSTPFEKSIARSNVPLFSINKKPERDFRASVRLFKLIRSLRPTIVHAQNIRVLDALIPAYLTRAPIRIHGEHGFHVSNLHVSNLKYQVLRRLLAPFVHAYIALSNQLSCYLHQKISIAREQITVFANGVDTDRFLPPSNMSAVRQRLFPAIPGDVNIVGSVARLEAVEDPLNLVRAVVAACCVLPEIRRRLVIVMIGDGSPEDAVDSLARGLGIRENLLLMGKRDDVPDILAAMDVLVSPSSAEGFSTTILEAIACGLPVIATDVGENATLVENGVTGRIIPSDDPEWLGAAIAEYMTIPARISMKGGEARRRVEREYTIDRKVAQYESIYDHCLSAISST